MSLSMNYFTWYFIVANEAGRELKSTTTPYSKCIIEAWVLVMRLDPSEVCLRGVKGDYSVRMSEIEIVRRLGRLSVSVRNGQDCLFMPGQCMSSNNHALHTEKNKENLSKSQRKWICGQRTVDRSTTAPWQLEHVRNQRSIRVPSLSVCRRPLLGMFVSHLVWLV